MSYHQDYINLIIKPTDACNLRCKHCYASESGYEVSKMSISVANNIIEFFSNSYKNIRIIWHGGEPLLMGIDFYKQIIEIQKKFPYNSITNCIQTNATLINNDWIDFFIANNIKVGISYDGPYNEVLRDKTAEVLKAIELMQKRKFRFGALCVICSETENKFIEIYNHFKRINVSFRFNPIFKSGEAKKHQALALSTKNYIEGCINFFNHWLYDSECKINIDNFIELVSKYFGINKTLCSNSSCLTKWLGILWNGDLYPCGRSFPDKYFLGNISNYEKAEDIFLSENYQMLLAGAINRRNWCKSHCDYYKDRKSVV